MSIGMKNLIKNSVRQMDEISEAQFNLIIGGCLAWGFLLNAFTIQANMAEKLISVTGYNGLIILYFIVAFGGIFINIMSKNPAISFLGYNMVVLAFGSLLEICLADYNPSIVFQAMTITGIITLAMMAISSLFPQFFIGIGKMLTLCLFVSIIVECIAAFIFGIHMKVMDFIVILIFCGYIGYDWGRATMITKTVDNAIDSAAALYMDIINIFIRVLASKR